MLEEAKVLEGDVAQALAAVSADLDLLVCGSRGHSLLAAALLGAVSAQLAYSSACPLIVLPRDRTGRGAAGIEQLREGAALSVDGRDA